MAISHRRWSQAARFDTLLSLPVRPEHHTPWNKTPQHLEQEVRIHRSPMKQMFPRFSQKQSRSSEAWLMWSPPESTKSKLYLPIAKAARKVNPTAYHASARRTLPPCIVHPIRVVMGATLRLDSRFLEAQGTLQIDIRSRY